jgi:hypothetical protein
VDALALELFLDTVEGRLAAALPAHLAASAQAYADGRAAPPSPTLAPTDAMRVLDGTTSKDTQLAARATSLLRVVAPTVIEADPRVDAARTAAPSWDAWRARCAARDSATRSLFGATHRELLHRLAGCSSESVSTHLGVPPKIDAWHATGPRVGENDVRAVWARLSHVRDRAQRARDHRDSVGR